MWIDKHKAFLEIKCRDCGEDLEAELDLSPAQTHTTIGVLVECSCTMGREQALDKQIEELEEEASERQKKEEK